jgi:hypothetical protein
MWWRLWSAAEPTQCCPHRSAINYFAVVALSKKSWTVQTSRYGWKVATLDSPVAADQQRWTEGGSLGAFGHGLRNAKAGFAKC